MKHSEAVDLLAWYVAGSLEPEENEGVEAHVDQCDECRSELKEMRMLQEAVAEVGAEEPVYRPALVNEALANIRRMERSAPLRRPAKPSLWATFQAFAADIGDRLAWNQTPAFARVAIGAQFAVLAALLVFVARAPSPSETYITASLPANTGPAVTVQFRDDVEVAELARVLGELDAEIIAGPSAANLYTIVAHGSGGSKQLATDMEASGLTRYVAPVLD